MKPFGFWRDPLCLVAFAGYVFNRWLVHHGVTQPFFRGYFDDVLVIPAALPMVLGMQRFVGLRRNDLPPTWGEIVFHVLIWSLVCEYFGPRWGHRGVADLWDVVAYAVGGAVSGAWWHRASRQGLQPQD